MKPNAKFGDSIFAELKTQHRTDRLPVCGTQHSAAELRGSELQKGFSHISSPQFPVQTTVILIQELLTAISQPPAVMQPCLPVVPRRQTPEANNYSLFNMTIYTGR